MRRSRADETEMAEHAAALSPSLEDTAAEADFAALLAALQEAERGRWFLAEFARRQRNADTVMVLDAVARIEARLAAQQAEPTGGTGQTVAADLARIIDEGRAALAQATEALAAFDTLKARLNTAGASDTAAASPAPQPPPEPEPTPIAARAPTPPVDDPTPGAPAASPLPQANSVTAAPPPAEPTSTLAPSALTPPAGPADELPIATAASLGAALLAEGMIRPSTPLRAGALAAVRRMTQADKLAFFS
jgi:hypothetical protein